MLLERHPFAPGAAYDFMWDCCAGTHARGGWHNNGNDLYAPVGTPLVAPVSGVVVRAGHLSSSDPTLGGARVGIEGQGRSVYMAHMQSLRVSQGDRVSAGDPVGEVGALRGIPSHLHFSMNLGSYGQQAFRNPRAELAALATPVGGRTFRVPDSAPPAEPDPEKFFLEKLQWHPVGRTGSSGPRVLGPWVGDTGARIRDRELEDMRAAGNLVAPMGDGARFYVYHYRQGSYGETFVYGPWHDVSRERKKEIRAMLEGRVGEPLRPFVGRHLSVYPVPG